MAPKEKRWRAAVGITLPDGRTVQTGRLLPKDFDPPEWLIDQGKVQPK